MSGFEVVGVILGLYPVIGAALTAYKESKGGKGAKILARDLNVERVIFYDFVEKLTGPNATEAELVRLQNSEFLDVALWRNVAVAAGNRLGLVKAKLIIEILQEICDLLKMLQKDLSLSSRGDCTDHGVV